MEEEKNPDSEAFQLFRNPSWRMKLLTSTHAKYCRHILLGVLPDIFEDYDTQRYRTMD